LRGQIGSLQASGPIVRRVIDPAAAALDGEADTVVLGTPLRDWHDHGLVVRRRHHGAEPVIARGEPARDGGR